jgi:hypothetical protein
MIFILLMCVISAWMAGILTVAAFTKGNEYWAGVFAGILFSLYCGIALIGYVSEHPL